MAVSPTYFNENDYELMFKDFSSGDFLNLGSGEYCAVTFDGVGSPELVENVYNMTGGDGVRFGIERYGVTTWNITGAIHTGINGNVAGGADTVWDAFSQLSRAWTNYPERTTARGVVPLYFKRPGREQMVVYGRPNRIDPVTKTSYAGHITYTATFRQSDPLFYSAEEEYLIVPFDESVQSGMLINESTEAFYLPFQTSTSTPIYGLIDNQGDAPASPVIQVHGYVETPIIVCMDMLGNIVWQIQLGIVVQAGQTATIDVRHWMRSATLTPDNTSLAGVITGDRLSELQLPAGFSRIQTAGLGADADAKIEINYRKAWYST